MACDSSNKLDDRRKDRATDWLEEALSDGAQSGWENSAITQLIDQVVGMVYDEARQPPVDPASKHLLPDVCNNQYQ